MLLSLCITCHCHFHTPGIGTCSFLNLECLNFQFVFSSSSLLEKRLKASVSCFQTMLILTLLDNLPSSNVNSRIYILKSPFLHLNQMSLSLEFCRISYDCFHRIKIETIFFTFIVSWLYPKVFLHKIRKQKYLVIVLSILLSICPLFTRQITLTLNVKNSCICLLGLL